MTDSTYASRSPYWRARASGISRDHAGWLLAGTAFAGLMIGVAAALRPELALAAVVAIAFVPVIFARPIVGLCALLALSFLEECSSGRFSSWSGSHVC
jgi:hypothetical protein